MDIKKHVNDNMLNIVLNDKFTFADHENFRSIFDDIRENKAIKHISLDLSHVTFIDSAALGMLLLLKDEVEKAEKNLTLSSPQGQVKKLLEISRFYELFTIAS